MKKALKWAGIVLGILIGLVVLLLGYVYFSTQARINKNYSIEPEAVAIHNDPEAIARGAHLAIVRACVDCHTADLGGGVVLEDPAIGLVYSSNLTSGQGGVAGHYTDADWVRAIRHGVDAEGKAVIFMPSWEFYTLSDEDLADIIAYVKSVPPVDRAPRENQMGMLIRTMWAFNQLGSPLLSAETIDHTAPRPAAPPVGVTAAYGGYLAIGCTGCHGEGLSGGPIPGAPPDFPPALNLTPGGELRGWTAADFIQTLRTGITPSGQQLRPEYMPWPVFGQMTDDELSAVFLYLQSLPAKEFGNR
jgi:mono/diheme cytochrome c family protein